MKKSLIWVLFTALCLLHVTLMSSCDNGCVQGQIKECSCPNGVQKQQICLSYKGDWEECPCEGETTNSTDNDTAPGDSEEMDAGDDAGEDSEAGTDDAVDTDKNTDTIVDSEQETDSTADSPEDTDDGGTVDASA